MSSLPIIIKLLIIVIILILEFITYTKIYKKITIEICNSILFSSAENQISLMKLFSKISLFIVFGLYVLLTPTIYYTLLFFIVWGSFCMLLIFSKMSINLMEYLMNFKFDQSLIDTSEYYSLVGSVENVNGTYVFTYLPGSFEIDIK